MSRPPVARRGTLMSRVTRSTIVATFALAAFFTGGLVPAASANAAGDSCANVEVVFARGTLEAPGVGATGQAFVDALNPRLQGKSVDVYGVDYPASLDFGRATDGIADASNRIQSIAANCPATKIVLGGYSQGAAVAGYTTASSVPAGFALPASISGPMPRPSPRTSRQWSYSERPTNGSSVSPITMHPDQHRTALRRKDPSAVRGR